MLDTSVRTPTPPTDLPRLGRPTAGRLFRLAQDLSRRSDLWQSRVRFAHETRYAVRVAVTDDYEAWLLTWLPGQSTGLHDHGGSAGAFIVLEGVVHEATFLPAPGRSPGALVKRTLGPGRVRAFSEDYLHDVANVGRVPAVSLHVYAPALETMRRFVLDELGRLQVVSLERSGADW
jgi:predicted metal-dependent enzyme (double-stranded beta helix superfamily)